MKRSEINARIREAMEFLKSMRVSLPPFSEWTPERWAEAGADVDEIRDNRLGWDVTDFGVGDFERVGLTLFTLRNGNYNNPLYAKPYAEKVIVVREAQAVPMHRHKTKMEDIIVRGGGNLMIELHSAGSDGRPAGGDVNVAVDGARVRVPSGFILRLIPGESICLTPGVFHSFWAEAGTGTALLGEVSSVNDDMTDNVFRDACGRFPTIEEDEAPFRLLCTEYP